MVAGQRERAYQVKSILLLSLVRILLGFSQDSRFKSLFWDELEELLGPILEPIVSPIFDILRDEATRLALLSTIAITSIIIAVMIFVVFELPLFFKWFVGVFDPDASPVSTSPSVHGTPTSITRHVTPSRVVARRTTKGKGEEEKAKREVIENVDGVEVRAFIIKNREEIQLDVIVDNQGDSKIEMAVVDIDLPFGFEILTKSFRMYRLGTVEAGDKEVATFYMRQIGGKIEDITGHIEFMSAAYEVTKINLPLPQMKE